MCTHKTHTHTCTRNKHNSPLQLTTPSSAAYTTSSNPLSQQSSTHEGNMTGMPSCLATCRNNTADHHDNKQQQQGTHVILGTPDLPSNEVGHLGRG